MRVISNGALAEAIDINDIEQFEKNDILYWYDVIDQNHAEALFALKGYPDHIINDSYTYFQTNWPTQIWCADLWLAHELEFFRNAKPQTLQTDYTVNFVINKKQINRYLAIKLCEFFNLEKGYTWSGVDGSFDMTDIIEEWRDIPVPFTDEVKTFLLSSITTPPHWVGRKNKQTNVNVSDYGSNWQSWQWGIDKIVGLSAVSIITESQRFEKAIHFSEKTAYAIFGQTFPIWVGGYRQADEWRIMGFDVFDDIIDHSYQYHDTLIERCWHAFADNLEILTDKHLADQYRRQHELRLRHNFDLLRGNQVKLSELRKIAEWPSELRELTLHIIDTVFPEIGYRSN